MRLLETGGLRAAGLSAALSCVLALDAAFCPAAFALLGGGAGNAEVASSTSNSPTISDQTAAATSSVAYASTFREFDDAMNDPAVGLIMVRGALAPRFFDGYGREYTVTRNLTISGLDASLGLIWFKVAPHAKLKLGGALSIACDRVIGTAIDVVDVQGELEVADSVSLHTDNGFGGVEYGYGVRVRNGGYADIHTDGLVRGSSGAVLIDEGGRAQIHGSGSYQSENATGYNDSGNVGANTGEGRMPVDNCGKLTVFGNPKIQGIGTEAGATSIIRGGVFQNVGVEQNTNPSFVNDGVVYLSGCTIGTGQNSTKNLIVSKKSRTVIMSSEDHPVNIEGFVLSVEAPRVSYDYRNRALSVEGGFSRGMSGLSEMAGLYESDNQFTNLDELAAHPDAIYDYIEGTEIDEARGIMFAREPAGTPTFTRPFVFSMLELKAGHNFGGKHDVLNDGGEVFVFGPTAPLSRVSVDACWEKLAYQIEGTWNPQTHQYENQRIVPVAKTPGAAVVSVAPDSTRPVQIRLDLEVAPEFSRSIGGAFDDAGAFFAMRPGQAARGELRLTGGSDIPYFSGTKIVGRAVASVLYAT